MALPPDFDPDAPGTDDGLYGLPFQADDARVVVIPVPWEATTSYGRGAAAGPAAIRAASLQVDLQDLDYGDFWRQGVALDAEQPGIRQLAEAVEADALANIDAGGGLADEIARVNAASDAVNTLVYEAAVRILDQGSIPAVLGGDHSSPYGLIRAIAERFAGVGVLHIDAHADLRVAYLGFEHSHASIFHNALKLPGLARLVGVGWRDVGGRELSRVKAEPDRIAAFFDRDLQRAAASGEPFLRTAQRIIDALPPQVYISFDIDGLDPALCPHTGTPVPGGLSFGQIQLLLAMLSEQRRVVGFDLCEVAPGPDGDEWDANVGARILYKLTGCAIRSQER